MKATSIKTLGIVGLGMLICGAAAVFGPALAIEIRRQGPIDPPPSAAFDQASSTIAIPYLSNGSLTLSTISKRGSNTGKEVQHRIVASNVYRLADFNRLTGQYLFQTLSSPAAESSAGVTTWVGDAQGHASQVVKGAGYVKLSPGGHFVVFDDAEGQLKLASISGTVVATYGQAGNAIFSHDGSMLAVFRGSPWGTTPTQGIEVYSVKTGEKLLRYAPSLRQYIPVSFSSDDKWLMFVTPRVGADGAQNGEGENRVNAYRIEIARQSATPRVMTGTAEGLPYVDYRQADLLAGGKLLVLSASDGTRILNTENGHVAFLKNVTGVASLNGDTAVVTWSVGETGKLSATVQDTASLERP